MGGTVPPKIFPGPSAIGGSDGSNVVQQAQTMPGATALGASVNPVNRAPVLPAPAPVARPPVRRPGPLPRGNPDAFYGAQPSRVLQLSSFGPATSRLRSPLLRYY